MRARYIAPVSRKPTPSSRATAFETLDFPEPDGPSMATMRCWLVIDQSLGQHLSAANTGAAAGNERWQPLAVGVPSGVSLE